MFFFFYPKEKDRVPSKREFRKQQEKEEKEGKVTEHVQVNAAYKKIYSARAPRSDGRAISCNIGRTHILRK